LPGTLAAAAALCSTKPLLLVPWINMPLKGVNDMQQLNLESTEKPNTAYNLQQCRILNTLNLDQTQSPYSPATMTFSLVFSQSSNQLICCLRCGV
jgi:hypothetical protein